MEYLKHLQSELVGAICSFTDDYTIYNLSVASKDLSELINTARNDILIQRSKQEGYDNYPLFKKQSVHQQTEPQIPILSDTYIEDVHSFETSHLASSVIVLIPESPVIEQVSHLITSIRIRGDIRSLQLTFAGHTICPLEYSIGSSGIDNDGYTEILTSFVPFLPIFCAQHLDTLLSIKTQGRVSVKVKKCCVSPVYLNALRWTEQPCVVPITRFDSSKVIANAVRGHTQYLCIPYSEGLGDEKRLGIHITIRNHNGENVHKKYIRAFSLTYSFDASPQILSARCTHVSEITKTPFYNLSTVPKHTTGFYIPLSLMNLEDSPFMFLSNPQSMRTLYIKFILKSPFTTSFLVDIKHYYQSNLKFHALTDDAQYDV